MNQTKRELGQNELASILEGKLEALRPHLMLISVITVGVLAVIILSVYLVTSRRAIEGSRWQELFLASNSDVSSLPDARILENVANENTGTIVSAVALLKSADVDILNALRGASESEEETLALMRRAKRNYGQVVESTIRGLDPMFKQRALYGLGYACEALGELDEAKKHYQTLVDEAKDTPIFKLAESGLRRVSDPALASLLGEYETWLANSQVAPGPTEDSGLSRPSIDFPLDPAPFGSDLGSRGTLGGDDQRKDEDDDAPAKQDADDDKATDQSSTDESSSQDESDEQASTEDDGQQNVPARL
ncbi:MAG TPA: tetratricopeptide repeat protein [Pirellulaceae bacterium]|nr:tetratricopeptide repeat protein [Pirellulaceae bacterium]HMO93955.1 tetratricopeptide repeat protein [Pirellulaceae bacterium]HMP67961.1 tetratricopeptide repeat protein [Pirellulaceae bacterium]